jgi:hypothetical protein
MTDAEIHALANRLAEAIARELKATFASQPCGVDAESTSSEESGGPTAEKMMARLRAKGWKPRPR